MQTIKGIYVNGHVELKELPSLPENSEVLVEIPDSPKAAIRVPAVTFGMFKDCGDFTEEDFDAAKFNVDKFMAEHED